MLICYNKTTNYPDFFKKNLKSSIKNILSRNKKHPNSWVYRSRKKNNEDNNKGMASLKTTEIIWNLEVPTLRKLHSNKSKGEITFVVKENEQNSSLATLH